MKVVILGGGYGTRLIRDMKTETSGKYKHLLDVPKSLLPVGGIPLMSHWMKIFKKSGCIEHIYIETNDVFYKQFKNWGEEWSGFVSVVNDQSNSNETRLGAVAAINFTARHFDITDENVIVMAGDTLFYKDFDLSEMLGKYESLKKEDNDSSLVTVYDCAKHNVVKHGILEVDDTTGQVTSFLEKPNPGMTSSTLACPCFYILSRAAIQETSVFLKGKENAPLSERDATGNFLKHLYQKLPVFTYKISGRFDVGGLSSYIDCLNYFEMTS